MNADTKIMEQGSAPTSGNAKLLGRGFEGLEPYLKKSRDLRQVLVRLGKIGDKATNRAARKLHHQLKHAEPSITMIGESLTVTGMEPVPELSRAIRLITNKASIGVILPSSLTSAFTFGFCNRLPETCT